MASYRYCLHRISCFCFLFHYNVDELF